MTRIVFFEFYTHFTRYTSVAAQPYELPSYRATRQKQETYYLTIGQEPPVINQKYPS